MYVDPADVMAPYSSSMLLLLSLDRCRAAVVAVVAAVGGDDVAKVDDVVDRGNIADADDDTVAYPLGKPRFIVIIIFVVAFIVPPLNALSPS